MANDPEIQNEKPDSNPSAPQQPSSIPKKKSKAGLFFILVKVMVIEKQLRSLIIQSA